MRTWPGIPIVDGFGYPSILLHMCPPTPEPAPSDNAANETLLTTLADRNGDFERIDAEMQDIVNVLRARGVSWAAIGQKLAVSRQAAWKRFG